MSGSVNKLIIVGHLGRAPEERRTQKNEMVVTFAVATTERWRDAATGERREATSWHNVVIYGERIGKIAMEYLKKGSQVYLEGQSLTRKWETKAGETRYTTEMVLKDFNGKLTLLDRAEREPPPPGSGSDYGGPATPPPVDDEVPF